MYLRTLVDFDVKWSAAPKVPLATVEKGKLRQTLTALLLLAHEKTDIPPSPEITICINRWSFAEQLRWTAWWKDFRNIIKSALFFTD
jgi:hypothetical protein